ncbi:ABC transporter permease [Paenibacillus alginolyticus]|uniref:ABC transporter permease n=1 Tax=Paenibacillus alginolyticus TaxID=59839 RepID=A0ABT4G7D4_9BACL|nr:ABC transporter permease [Paenibacillus alginolyticus]MCY9692082.1 ABC transporter permease [Paenibacillus alginolyticus]MEC0147847.1 ABC transporter permease [Paenibacillus alginolyticus]
MRIWELFQMALATVRSNPLRTVLTMLGVIIGVSSVITLVSIGQGTSKAIEKQYEGLGTNLLTVNLMGNGRATQLNYDEIMQLENTSGISAIAPTMTRNSTSIKYDRTTETYNVIGTNDRYLSLQKGTVASGRFLAQADLDFRNHVAVIGSDVAKQFFGTDDPIDEEINVYGYMYTIIGVLKTKGSNTSGTSLDSSVYVPLPTMSRDFKLGNIRTAYVEAASGNDVTRAQRTLELYLFNKFKSTTGYNILNSSELISARQTASSTLTNQLVAVAAISLLVGGIGIMNIMLVTVSERTREIGIRKSIGAKRRNILLQFLVEATLISGMGGLIGLILGIGLSLAWPYINPSQQTSLSINIGLYAFLFSALVGVVFGLYPANKASKLKPIDALRFD